MATLPTLPMPAQRWLRRNWLTSVMLITYLLLSLLILEQGRTIEAQRSLIRQLFVDSQQLTALRLVQQRDHSRPQQ